jgi:hypothetical protein
MHGLTNAQGQTSQLTLEGTLSDGSKKDVTSTALWSSSNRNVVTVTAAGLAMAVDFGQASVQGSSMAAAKSSPDFVMNVLPAGTCILSERVTEGGNLPVADVRVETIGGPMTDRAVMTDAAGSYAFNGVSGVVQVRPTKDGYQPATQTVTQDTQHVNVGLTPILPYASPDGVYSLTFTASPSCNLPDDAVKRTYTGTICPDRRRADDRSFRCTIRELGSGDLEPVLQPRAWHRRVVRVLQPHVLRVLLRCRPCRTAGR